MNEEEIASLCASMSLKEKEGPMWSLKNKLKDDGLRKMSLSLVGSIIGDVEEIDEGASGDCDGKFLRVRVVIDVEKPLRRILRVDVLSNGVESVMFLKYKCLPDHCFCYGRLGHKTRPERGFFKVNTYASIKANQGYIREGVIIRNHFGAIRGSFIQRIHAMFFPQVAEASALLRGAMFAVDASLVSAVYLM
ncbi:hypothetical protein EZV62_014855 [Acer yangbiense]|uniref:Uncharacterized protein n=1 Tax=Acer yangbiense TaxID=1000413 RepID=A0A5C7HVQ7_9ROSI|nr:hypothetical protein EZV62_014855 [Acer yangbiense]